MVMSELPELPVSPEPRSPEEEGRHHRYVTNAIPWYVHLIWVLFWIFAIIYILRYLIGPLQRELLGPP